MTYSELLDIPDFFDRIELLRTYEPVGVPTFGPTRHLNQALYMSREWKRVRRLVTIRDNACDLAHPERPIFGGIYVHHLEPITADDILERRANVFSLENLVCVSLDTHNLIHYGGQPNETLRPITRYKGDHCLWKKV